MKKLIILALMLSVLSSAIYAGTLSGYVRDQNGNPVAGARVWNFRADGAGTDVLTDATGFYSVTGGTSPGFHVYKEGYSMPYRWQEDGDLGSGTYDWTLNNLYGEFDTVYDNFDSGTFDRTTMDAGQYNWQQRTSGAAVSGGNLVVNAGNVVGITDDADGGYFAPGNFDMSFRFKPDAGWSWLIFNFHANVGGTVPDYNAAENIAINPNGSIFGSAARNYDGGWGQPESTYRGATAIDWNVYHTVRVKSVGYNVGVYWDGTLVGSKYWNGQTSDYNGDNKGGAELQYVNGQVRTGFVTFAAFGANSNIDWVNVQAVPEPSSFVALFTGMAGLVGFAIRRRS